MEIKKKNSSPEKASLSSRFRNVDRRAKGGSREGKKIQASTKPRRKNLSLGSKFEIQGRNYGKYEAALSNAFQHPPRFSRARFISLEATGNDIFKACRSRVRSTRTAYHQVDFMGHLLDTIQAL